MGNSMGTLLTNDHLPLSIGFPWGHPSPSWVIEVVWAPHVNQ